MIHPIKSSFSKAPNKSLLNGRQTLYLSFFLTTIFLFLFESLIFTAPRSHGFYFDNPLLQRSSVYFEVLLPSIVIILLLIGPRTVFGLYALWFLVPINLIFLTVIFFVSDCHMEKISGNEFDIRTSAWVKKQKIGDVVVCMNSSPYLGRGSSKDSFMLTRLWIERPVFYGILREFKMLAVVETLSGAKFVVIEKEKKIRLLYRNCYGITGEREYLVQWTSLPII